MPSSNSMILRLVICFNIFILVTANMNDRQRYCGTHLSQMLHIFCNGIYNSMTMEKKSGEDMDDYVYANDQALLEDSPLAYSSVPFLDRFASAAALNPRVRRHETYYLRRGVVDECCRKPCTFQELTSYCKKD